MWRTLRWVVPSGPPARLWSAVSARQSGDRGIYPLEALVTAQNRKGLEDPRRDRRSGDRDADRLGELGRLGGELLGERREAALHRLGVEAVGVGERRAGPLQQLGRPLFHHLGPGLLVLDGGFEREADQGPDLLEGLGFVLRRGAGLFQALLSRLAADAGGDRCDVIPPRHLPHVAAVHPAQLLLVDDRRRPAQLFA